VVGVLISPQDEGLGGANFTKRAGVVVGGSCLQARKTRWVREEKVGKLVGFNSKNNDKKGEKKKSSAERKGGPKRKFGPRSTNGEPVHRRKKKNFLRDCKRMGTMNRSTLFSSALLPFLTAEKRNKRNTRQLLVAAPWAHES